jgi:transposase
MLSLMKALSIGNPEVMVLALQEEIQRSPESRYDHRLHGVLLVAQGMSPPAVARLLGDAPRTVEYWVHRFEADGLAGLREGVRPGRPSRLDPAQAAQVQAALRGKPAEVGLSGTRWDGKTLAAYVQQLGVALRPRQCRNLLRQWAFRYRQPRPVIARADPEKPAAQENPPGPGRRPRRRSGGAR